MAVDAIPNGPAPRPLPALNDPSMHRQQKPNNPNSAAKSQRRHSLPLQYLPPGLWSTNTSSTSLVVESGEAARGEHILDEATVAHRISALRQLNGATTTRHRYAKSTGARNSTFSQPVIVRTYSGAARTPSNQREIVTAKKENGYSDMSRVNKELKMPPVEAFSFKGIMEEIKQGVAEDLERIAEICARSKYSLSNQYEVHMPPHGRGEPIIQHTDLGVGHHTAVGPTLQAITSDDEQNRPVARGYRGGRRTKSVAYGTLETIMSSSRSSDEDKSKKKPAAVLAEEVRGRVARKELQAAAKKDKTEEATKTSPDTERPSKHVRSKLASFASMIIDNAQVSKYDLDCQILSPTSLVSEPAQPQTSTATDIESFVASEVHQNVSVYNSLSLPGPIRSVATSSKPESKRQPSVMGSLGSWLPWAKTGGSSSESLQGRNRSVSYAEGSLRYLLKSTDLGRKGKAVEGTGPKPTPSGSERVVG
ncbi:uncharacterized protein RAG0_16491 [Rhynchosporium agropyri]|uniref:Uncharacterized protein n=1 Tax=Rhynchosporium agropyri TaxID=914238 RepID=A0A1E1LQP4_9HELO|nr:uncharacterized protein RAG0_16491 [Rhynchosporium agropyri]